MQKPKSGQDRNQEKKQNKGKGGKDYLVPKVWFNHGYAQLLIYLRDHPGLNIPCDYKTRDGMTLKNWVETVRTLWGEGYLSGEQENKLRVACLAPKSSDQSWESMYRLARMHFILTGESPGREFRSEEGTMLGAWLDRQKRLFYSLSKDQQNKLLEIGVSPYETESVSTQSDGI